jgi:hypothetical protein
VALLLLYLLRRPQSVKKVYILNAPFAFRGLWAIVKPWLHPNTRAAIEICSGNFLEVFEANGPPLPSPPLPSTQASATCHVVCGATCHTVRCVRAACLLCSLLSALCSLLSALCSLLCSALWFSIH